MSYSRQVLLPEDLKGAKTMKNIVSRVIVCVLALLVLSRAETLPIIPTETISSGGSSLVLKVDDATVFRRPFSLDLTIDGQSLLVFSSQPTDRLGGFHHLHGGGPGTHIEPNQIHLAGPLVGSSGLRGGVVYTLTRTGSVSRVTEKVDVASTVSATIKWTGLGANPFTLGDTFATRHGFSNAAALPSPDLTGWQIAGTTLVFSQTGSLVDGPPFAPVSILPVVSFTGFNPFDQNVSVTGCTMAAPCQITMVTELNISRLPPVIEWTLVLLIIVLVLLGAAGLLAWRRRSQRR